MIRRQWLALFFLIYLILGVILYRGLAGHLTEKPVDMVAVNRIIHSAASQWENKDFQKSPDCPYEYGIFDLQGRLLYKSSDMVCGTVYEAMAQRHTVADIRQNGMALGKAVIVTGYGPELEAGRKWLGASFLLFFLYLLLPAILYYKYLYQRIIRPFQDLKAFARHIAAGNLDFPLPMDQGHVFGEFTESFDIMREELLEARQREAEATKSKKELIASLSHDIKTPVASIKLVSELLLATEPPGKTRDKIGTIYEKAGQIDHLVTNLFQASLEDLGKMTVHISEESSQALASMIRSADYKELAQMASIPGCLLLMDSLRISQVIDNIIHNSYKYADTPIEITFQEKEHHLVMAFRDSGKGVPDEELPFLFQKFYRGKAHIHEKQEGSGLGLYISRLLMEEMGGTITCFNLPDGFVTEVGIPMAGSL